MKKKWGLFIGLSGILGALAYLVWGGLDQNLVYFVTPSELAAKGDNAIGAPVRLGGMVLTGSVSKEANTTSFTITDHQKDILVKTHTTPPQMFQESMGVVVEGAMTAEGYFLAERVMIKHGNDYHPPKEGQMPAEIYKQILKDK